MGQPIRSTDSLVPKLLKGSSTRSLAGAPDDAHVTITQEHGRDQVYVSVQHPAYSLRTRDIRKLPDGTIVMHNNHYTSRDGFQDERHAGPKYHNLAVRSAARQVAMAHELGVHQIDTHVLRSDASGYVGYNVRPRHGFNGPIPADVKQKLGIGITNAGGAQ